MLTTLLEDSEVCPLAGDDPSEFCFVSTFDELPLLLDMTGTETLRTTVTGVMAPGRVGSRLARFAREEWER